jgi:hypothetical protein
MNLRSDGGNHCLALPPEKKHVNKDLINVHSFCVVSWGEATD